MGNSPKLSIQTIQKRLPTIKILSSEYVRQNVPLQYECECSEIATGIYGNLEKGRRHKGCRKKESERRLFKFHEMRSYVMSIQYTLLSDDFPYYKHPLKCRCPNGHDINVTFEALKRGDRCRLCFIARNRGTNHHWYKHSLTNEHRTYRRNNRGPDSAWANAVKQRDNYTCRVCLKKDHVRIVAHHINSYGKFPELRLELTNGITLCEDCHRAFHSLYGKGGNDASQWELFIQYKKAQLKGDV